MKDEGAYAARHKRLRGALRREGLDGIIVVPGPNMKYYTSVNSVFLERPFLLLVPAEGEARLVAPELEAGPYRECPLTMKIESWTDSAGWAGAMKRAVKGAGVSGSWGVEGRTPYLFLDRLMRHARPKLADGEPVLQGLREVKDEAEILLLKRSARILSRSFEEFPALIKEGASEVEIAARATKIIYSNGATKVDDMLVQSGPRCADPHGLPTKRKVKRGEGVIIDVGTTYEGYYADITRTYAVGRGKDFEAIYAVVLEAEESGIGAAHAGAEVGEIDGAARGVLRRAGLGKYFIHRTGHGLGLEVHEAPYIVEGGKERLLDGMAFTVEPGAYIRGKLGVRIEDDVLVEGGRGRAMTNTPKELGWWR
jgi:Xaa-Pro aminopeptidase